MLPTSVSWQTACMLPPAINSNLLENPALRVAHECDCAAILLSRHISKLSMPTFRDSRS